MMRRLSWVLGGALSLSALLASTAMAADRDKRTPSDAEIQARADALIAQMTPEEKAGQLVDMFMIIPALSKKNEAMVAAGVVGSLLFETEPAEINRLQHIAVDQSRLKIPLLFGFDVIHGLRTIFPVPIAGAASWDPDLVSRNQAIAAKEARTSGITWVFAPMVDIARDPRWGRMVEGAGEDPYLGSAMAAAQVRGFQGNAIGTADHVIAGPKHFAGYGAALGGRDYDEVNLSDSELWNTYLPPFKAAIDAGAGNLMSAYMPMNGIPATGNHWLLTDVLRKQWGFKGFVVSDADAVRNLTNHGYAVDFKDAAVRSLTAGDDMEMALFTPAYSNLPEALRQGRITQPQLDDAVRHILEAKIRMGLFEHPYVDERRAVTIAADPTHLIAARIAAERSAVLLRNEGDLLPLDAKAVKSVAVIGPLANSAKDALGPWVFGQAQPIKSTILSGIVDKLHQSRVTYVQGVSLPPRLNASPFMALNVDPRVTIPTIDDTAGIAQAVAAVRAADVAVLVLGEGQDMSGESASESTLALPGRQQDLLDAVVATGKPVVVMLMNGRPLDLKDSQAAAILDIWYPGSAAGAAAANLLFGDATPGGKLPFSWPRDVGQVPLIYAHLPSHEPEKINKRYWNAPGAPVYPFGYGLSYSTFAFANLRTNQTRIAPGGTVTVSVDLTNTGKRRADEVAQLYIHQRAGNAARPVRELKGFQRVTLDPGEHRLITFRLGDAEFRYWNAATHDWVIDDTVFDLAVGGDSTTPFGANVQVLKTPG